MLPSDRGPSMAPTPNTLPRPVPRQAINAQRAERKKPLPKPKPKPVPGQAINADLVDYQRQYRQATAAPAIPDNPVANFDDPSKDVQTQGLSSSNPYSHQVPVNGTFTNDANDLTTQVGKRQINKWAGADLAVPYANYDPSTQDDAKRFAADTIRRQNAAIAKEYHGYDPSGAGMAAYSYKVKIPDGLKSHPTLVAAGISQRLTQEQWDALEFTTEATDRAIRASKLAQVSQKDGQDYFAAQTPIMQQGMIASLNSLSDIYKSVADTGNNPATTAISNIYNSKWDPFKYVVDAGMGIFNGGQDLLHHSVRAAGLALAQGQGLSDAWASTSKGKFDIGTVDALRKQYGDALVQAAMDWSLTKTLHPGDPNGAADFLDKYVDSQNPAVRALLQQAFNGEVMNGDPTDVKSLLDQIEAARTDNLGHMVSNQFGFLGEGDRRVLDSTVNAAATFFLDPFLIGGKIAKTYKLAMWGTENIARAAKWEDAAGNVLKGANRLETGALTAEGATRAISRTFGRTEDGARATDLTLTEARRATAVNRFWSEFGKDMQRYISGNTAEKAKMKRRMDIKYSGWFGNGRQLDEDFLSQMVAHQVTGPESAWAYFKNADAAQRLIMGQAARVDPYIPHMSKAKATALEARMKVRGAVLEPRSMLDVSDILTDNISAQQAADLLSEPKVVSALADRTGWKANELRASALSAGDTVKPTIAGTKVSMAPQVKASASWLTSKGWRRRITKVSRWVEGHPMTSHGIDIATGEDAPLIYKLSRATFDRPTSRLLAQVWREADENQRVNILQGITMTMAEGRGLFRGDAKQAALVRDALTVGLRSGELYSPEMIVATDVTKIIKSLGDVDTSRAAAMLPDLETYGAAQSAALGRSVHVWVRRQQEAEGVLAQKRLALKAVNTRIAQAKQAGATAEELDRMHQGAQAVWTEVKAAEADAKVLGAELDTLARSHQQLWNGTMGQVDKVAQEVVRGGSEAQRGIAHDAFVQIAKIARGEAKDAQGKQLITAVKADAEARVVADSKDIAATQSQVLSDLIGVSRSEADSIIARMSADDRAAIALIAEQGASATKAAAALTRKLERKAGKYLNAQGKAEAQAAGEVSRRGTSVLELTNQIAEQQQAIGLAFHKIRLLVKQRALLADREYMAANMAEFEGTQRALHLWQASDRVRLPNMSVIDQLSARTSLASRLMGWTWGDKARVATDIWSFGTLAGPRFAVRNALEDWFGYWMAGGTIKDGWTGRQLSQTVHELRGQLGVVQKNRRRAGDLLAKAPGMPGEDELPGTLGSLFLRSLPDDKLVAAQQAIADGDWAGLEDYFREAIARSHLGKGASEQEVSYLTDLYKFGGIRAHDDVSEVARALDGKVAPDGDPVAAARDLDTTPQQGQAFHDFLWTRSDRDRSRFTTVSTTSDEGRQWWLRGIAGVAHNDGPIGQIALGYLSRAVTVDQAVEKGVIKRIAEAITNDESWGYKSRLSALADASPKKVNEFAARYFYDVANLFSAKGIAVNQALLAKMRDGDKGFKVWAKNEDGTRRYLLGKFDLAHVGEEGAGYLRPDWVLGTKLEANTFADGLGGLQVGTRTWDAMGRSMARMSRSPIFMANYTKARRQLAVLQKSHEAQLLGDTAQATALAKRHDELEAFRAAYHDEMDRKLRIWLHDPGDTLQGPPPEGEIFTLAAESAAGKPVDLHAFSKSLADEAAGGTGDVTDWEHVPIPVRERLMPGPYAGDDSLLARLMDLSWHAQRADRYDADTLELLRRDAAALRQDAHTVGAGKEFTERIDTVEHGIDHPRSSAGLLDNVDPEPLDNMFGDGRFLTAEVEAAVADKADELARTITAKTVATDPEAVSRAAMVAARHTHDVAVQRAEAVTLSYADNPNNRSVGAFYARNISRYWRAQEDFYRRMIRMAKYEPEGLYKGFLAIYSLQNAGFMNRDENGNAYFTYPITGPLYRITARVLNQLGIETMPEAPVDFTGQLMMLTPSLDPQGLLATASGPMAALTKYAVDSTPILRDWSTALYGSRSEGQGFAQAMVPASAGRALDFLRAVTTRETWDEESSRALLAAVQAYVASGQTYDTTDPISVARARAQIGNSAALVTLLAAIARPTTPAAPQYKNAVGTSEELKRAGLNGIASVFYALLQKHADAPDVYAKAVNEFLYPDTATGGMRPEDWRKAAINPNLLVATAATTESKSGARLTRTQASYHWIKDNLHIIKNHPYGAPYLAPAEYESKFFFPADTWMKLEGMVSKKKGMDYLRDLATLDDQQFYYQKKAQFEQAKAEWVAQGGKVKDADSAWSQWKSEYLNQHPLLAEKMSELGGRERAIRAYHDVIASLRWKQANKASMEPGEVAIGQMVADYQALQDYKSQNPGLPTKSTVPGQPSLQSVNEGFIDQSVNKLLAAHPESRRQLSVFFHNVISPMMNGTYDDLVVRY